MQHHSKHTYNKSECSSMECTRAHTHTTQASTQNASLLVAHIIQCVCIRPYSFILLQYTYRNSITFERARSSSQKLKQLLEMTNCILFLCQIKSRMRMRDLNVRNIYCPNEGRALSMRSMLCCVCYMHSLFLSIYMGINVCKSGQTLHIIRSNNQWPANWEWTICICIIYLLYCSQFG